MPFRHNYTSRVCGVTRGDALSQVVDLFKNLKRHFRGKQVYQPKLAFAATL